jgi:hypothetical protein
MFRVKILTLLALCGCGDLQGLDDSEPIPLAKIKVKTSGSFESVRAPMATNERLRATVIWGTQRLPEALCFFPPESPEVAAVVAAGCRNPLSFTPLLVGASTPLVPDEEATIELDALPPPEVLLGTATARVGYASIVVYDDRNDLGSLQLTDDIRFNFENDTTLDLLSDIIYGASFVSMTQPDTRLAFREGEFIETGFYPRKGCPAPLSGFSIARAGGFSLADAITATAEGKLPLQSAESCEQLSLAQVVTVPLSPNSAVREVGCEQSEGGLNSSVIYRAPENPPNTEEEVFACAKIPKFSSEPSVTDDITQLILAPKKTEACRRVKHYTLFGCFARSFDECKEPDWDFRQTPPAWWPCK